jgi:hypothetical protein
MFLKRSSPTKAAAAHAGFDRLWLLMLEAKWGIPVESENRTVTGIALPLNSAALLNFGAPKDALKLPSTTIPLA